MSVLFADLVGFTSRAEQMDPEDVRAILEPYHARLRTELERRGGTVEKFIGDAVMALFGAPTAHEDDPERAVRAGARDPRLDPRGEMTSRFGSAVTTGEALVALGARPTEGEGMASGDVVNTAARLQSAAPVNGILVDETTYRATDQKIDYSESEPVTAKGKQEPVPAWEVHRGPLELRRRRRPGAARSADRPRARGRRARGRAGTCARGAIAAARHPRRRPRDRQEPSRLRALAGDRERGRADQLAPGPLTPLRRRRLLLGAVRDGQGAGGDPRDRLVGGDGEQARSRASGSSSTSRRRNGSSGTSAR